MTASMSPDGIGIEYQIDLQKLAASIRSSKQLLEKFHKDLAGLAKKASVTITIKDQQAKAKVKKFASAIQAELDKTGALKIKAVPESFGKISGANMVPRMTKDYQELSKAMGKLKLPVSNTNVLFKKVNNSIAEHSMRLQAAGKDGVSYYRNADRSNIALQTLNGSLKATSTGLVNVALSEQKAATASAESAKARVLQKTQLKATAVAAKDAVKAQKDLAAAAVSTSTQLRGMGITSGTTATSLRKMNLSALENSRALTLVNARMNELKSGMLVGGKATKSASDEFTRLQRLMPHLEHESNKGIKAFGDYRRAMDRWSGGFKYMMLSQLAWIASGAVLFGTLAAIGTAFKDIVEYHQGMKGLEAITRANADEMQLMSDAINNAAVATKFFAGDMTKAATIMAQAGFSAKEISSSIGGIALLASAANRSLEDTADLMTTVIRAYELSASESVRIANILAAGIVNSKLQIEDLRTAFNYMGVAAHQFNLSLEDTVAWLGILRDRGLKASTIGTSFRMVLASLVRDTKKFRDVLKGLKDPLGFADVTIRNGRKLEVAMERLAKAGFNVTDAFVALPQRTAMTFSLMVQNTETFRKMRDAVTNTTTAIKMNVVQMTGLEYSLRQIKSLWFEITRSLARDGGAFTGMVSGLKTVIQQIGSIAVFIDGMFKALLNSIVATAALVSYKFKSLPTNITELIVSLYASAEKAGLNPTTKRFKIDEKGKPISTPKSGYAEYAKGVLKQLEIDNQKIADETYKTLNRILAPTLLTPEEEKAEKNKSKLQELRAEQEKLVAQWDKIKDHGSAAGLELFGKLSLVNAQIREMEQELGTLEGAISGPVESLKDIMLGMAVKPGMKPDDLLNVFRKGEDSIKLTSKAVNQLRDDFNEAFKAAAAGNLSKDTEEYKRMLSAAEALIAGEKKLSELRSKELTKRQKADEKEYKDRYKLFYKQLKEMDRLEKSKEQIEKKFLAFKGGIDKEIADQEINEYQRKIGLWQAEVNERKRKYNILLKEAEAYYDAVQSAAIGNPYLVGEEDDAARMVTTIKGMIAKLEQLGILERKKIIAPEDFARGMEDGFREARDELANENETWKALTKNTATAMSDTFSDMFFDGMTGKLTTLGDYWRAFSQAVQREIANMAARWLSSGLLGTDQKASWLKLAFTAASAYAGSSGAGAGEGEGMAYMTHGGGFIKKMHGGGYNLKNNEQLRVLKEGEYVIKDASTKSIGVGQLDFMNQTGKVPGGNVVKNFNTYTIIAMDSESMDQALRRGGARAISEISMNNFARERERQSPTARRF
uniref:Putative tail protein n=1 Tax=viral metagenome TaxID=1070528 RepID=A0A6M3IVC3_9ZZZZ